MTSISLIIFKAFELSIVFTKTETSVSKAWNSRSLRADFTWNLFFTIYFDNINDLCE